MAIVAAQGVWQVIADRAVATPDLVLGVDDRGRSLTCRAFADGAERLAAGLVAHGIGPGSKVSWQLPTNFESMMLSAALARLGAVQNPIIPIYREREVGFCVRQTEADLVIVPHELRGFDFEAMVRPIAASVPGCEVLVFAGEPGAGGEPDGDPAVLPPLPVVPLPPADARWIYYTSGTTSDPKGAMHTDASVIASAMNMVRALELSEADNWPLVFPFTHVGGIGLLLASLIAGPKLVVSDTFDPAVTPLFLAEHDITIAGSGAYFFMSYLAAQAEGPDQPLFPNLRCATGGGSVTPVGLHHRVKQELGGRGIMSSYGLTEIPIVTFANYGDPDDKLDTTEGRAVPGYDFKVIDASGAEAPAGIEGELLVRGPSQCLGYLDSSLDAAAFDDDGYFRTGDLGIIDREGYISITGRAKDVIIRNGENISARAVEDLLFTHPKIREVAAIGLPDERTGERCCAVVALADQATAIDLDEIRTYLRGKGLMMQMVPEQVEFLPSLPRNPAGKILKKDLRAQFAPAS